MRLDLPLPWPPLFWSRASLWAKWQGTQLVTLSPGFSCWRDALQAWVIEQAIRPEWATEPAQYKRLQMRLQKLAIKFS